MNNLISSLLIAFIWPGTSATPPAATATVESTATRPTLTTYNFSRPTASYTMPPELMELSGIAFSGPEQLTGVEDETGRLYHYNLRTRRVERTVDFGPAGDYEDLARVGSDWFILRSDGTLFRYGATGTKQYETGLTLANNAEGLTYDTRSNTLLVACKGTPGGTLTGTKRAIYRLHPTTYKVQTPAAYVLDVDAIVAAAPVLADASETKKGKKAKGPAGLKGFAPSAVAVHPRTGHVFVLSARQNALVELGTDGQMLAAQALPPSLFPQAEGLAFAANGDLYIATEAGKKSGQAMIYHFSGAR